MERYRLLHADANVRVRPRLHLPVVPPAPAALRVAGTNATATASDIAATTARSDALAPSHAAHADGSWKSNVAEHVDEPGWFHLVASGGDTAHVCGHPAVEAVKTAHAASRVAAEENAYRR